MKYHIFGGTNTDFQYDFSQETDWLLPRSSASCSQQLLGRLRRKLLCFENFLLIKLHVWSLHYMFLRSWGCVRHCSFDNLAPKDAKGIYPLQAFATWYGGGQANYSQEFMYPCPDCCNAGLELTIWFDKTK
jgi:hypothetical protein